MQNLTSRRRLVKVGLSFSALAPIFWFAQTPARAAALQPLDPNDPQAKALGFVADASAVAIAANPTFKPGQKCATCAQYQGKQTDATAGCNIFPGHTVPAAGWCKVWAQRTGA